MKPLLTSCLILTSCFTTSQAATIIFADDFGTGGTTTYRNNGATFTSGTSAASPGNWSITTTGNQGVGTLFTGGAASTTFDADGVAVASSGNGHIALGSGNQVPVNSISRQINLTAGETYNVYFLYRSNTAGGNTQGVRATLALGAESQNFTATTTSATYATGTLSFTPTTSGSATLTFDDTGSSTVNKDIFIDSIVVSGPDPIPEPSSTALIGLASLGFILRRRR